MVSAGICSVPLSVVLSTMQVSGITLHGLRAPLSCMASLRNLDHAGSAQSARDFRCVKNKTKENTGYRETRKLDGAVLACR